MEPWGVYPPPTRMLTLTQVDSPYLEESLDIASLPGDPSSVLHSLR